MTKRRRRTKNCRGKFYSGKIATDKKGTANKGYKGKYLSRKLFNFNPREKISRFWDVRLWFPAFIIILIIAVNMKGNSVAAEYESKINEIQLAAETTPIEIHVEEETTVPEETTPSEEERDIIALAILADTVGHGKNDEVKRAIMWVAINRSEDTRNGYGLSLQGEIARPKQWQQYDPDGVYLASTYEIAESVYYTWKNNGPRPMYNDMLWFSFNSDGSITVRNVFSGTKGRSEQTFGYDNNAQ